jgi:hypothetical protein
MNVTNYLTRVDTFQDASDGRGTVAPLMPGGMTRLNPFLYANVAKGDA